MTRIVTNDYRYKWPKPRRKPAPLGMPAVVKAADPAKARKRVAKSDRIPEAATTAANDERKPAIVTAPQMELPLSRQSVEREGNDYKRLKAAMARRLRGE